MTIPTTNTTQKPARHRKTAGDPRPVAKRRQTNKTTTQAAPPAVIEQRQETPPDLSPEALAEAEEERSRAVAFAKADRHRQAIAAVDQRERQAIAAFDTHRRTWAARAIAIVKGRRHFDRQQKDITDRHEAERMILRRAFTQPRTRED